MEQNSMTALVSAFSRAYHAKENDVKIFYDSVVGQLLSDEEYRAISENMANGVRYFDPDFSGSAEDALRRVVDRQLSPSPLGRAAFAEAALARAVSIGARQYLIFGAGYDTFAYRQPEWARSLEIFEIDHPKTAQDKKRRLSAAKLAILPNVHLLEADLTQEGWQDALSQNAAFDASRISFCSLLGLTYYLTKESFCRLCAVLRPLLPLGSALAFDYPVAAEKSRSADIQAALADAAKERMLARYSYDELEHMLSEQDFLIYEHLTPREITAEYFARYNNANPAHPMAALDAVNFCLAVKR